MNYKLNGKAVSQEGFLEGSTDEWMDGPPMIPNTYRAHDPLVSESLGVLPHQLQEERRKLRAEHDKGYLTGVSLLDNGAAAFEDRGEAGRIGWMRHRGNKIDADGGYGDTYTPT